MDVPTVQVLFSRTHDRSIYPYSFPISSAVLSPPSATEGDILIHRDKVAQARGKLLSWIANEALDGDLHVAEWVLLTICSKV